MHIELSLPREEIAEQNQVSPKGRLNPGSGHFLGLLVAGAGGESHDCRRKSSLCCGSRGRHDCHALPSLRGLSLRWLVTDQHAYAPPGDRGSPKSPPLLLLGNLQLRWQWRQQGGQGLLLLVVGRGLARQEAPQPLARLAHALFGYKEAAAAVGTVEKARLDKIMFCASVCRKDRCRKE